MSPRRLSVLPLRRVARIVAFVVLSGAGLLGLTTDAFRSPRSIVRDALVRAQKPSDAELRFLVDVRSDPKRAAGQFHYLHFRAGPGPLLWSVGSLPALQFPFQLSLARRGVVLTFKGSTIVRDGASYVRVSEMPAYGDLGKTLEGRWLQVSERREGGGKTLVGDESTRLLQQMLAPDVLSVVERGKAEGVRDVRAHSYRLQFDDERLGALVGELPGAFPEHRGVSAVARFLDGRLREFRVEHVMLWIRPRSHTLVRARLELTPRVAGAEIQRVILDATLLPLKGAKPPAVPAGAVRLRPETLQKLLPR